MPKDEWVSPKWKRTIITWDTRERLVDGEEYRILAHSYILYAVDQAILVKRSINYFYFEPTLSPGGLITLSPWRCMSNPILRPGITKVMFIDHYEQMKKESNEEPNSHNRSNSWCQTRDCGEQQDSSCSWCQCSSPETTRVWIDHNVGEITVCKKCGKEIDNIPF